MVLQLLQMHTSMAYDWSYFIAWIGVSWSLVSALLFSGASVCLRNERKREDAKNMAYLMPGNIWSLLIFCLLILINHHIFYISLYAYNTQNLITRTVYILIPTISFLLIALPSCLKYTQKLTLTFWKFNLRGASNCITNASLLFNPVGTQNYSCLGLYLFDYL